MEERCEDSTKSHVDDDDLEDVVMKLLSERSSRSGRQQDEPKADAEQIAVSTSTEEDDDTNKEKCDEVDLEAAVTILPVTKALPYADIHKFTDCNVDSRRAKVPPSPLLSVVALPAAMPTPEADSDEYPPGAYAVAPLAPFGRSGQRSSMESTTRNEPVANTAVSHSGSERPPQRELGLSDSGRLVTATLVDEQEEIGRADPVEDVKHTGNESFKRQYAKPLLATVALAVGLLIALILATILRNVRNNGKSTAEIDSGNHNMTVTRLEDVLPLLPSRTQLKIQNVKDSPQALAYQWLIDDPFLFSQNYTNASWRLVQRYALATLYYANGGSKWKDQMSWLSYELHECSWGFVRSAHYDWPTINRILSVKSPCEDKEAPGVYTDLRLSNNELTGNLPDELALLSSLKSMDLSLNSLTGMLSNDIFSSLHNLETVALAYNAFSGSIPMALSGSSEPVLPLVNVILYGNSFTGTIASTLGELIDLELLVIAATNLTGPIPTELGKLTKLEILIFEHLPVQDQLPSELGSLSSLKQLYLQSNSLSGTLPSELGRLSQLVELRLNENQFSGWIPTEIGLMGRLEKLYLGRNMMSGPIPTELAQMARLRRIRLPKNSFTGSFPFSAFEGHPALEYIDVRGNEVLTGTIPNELCGMSDGLEFDCPSLVCGCGCHC